MNGYEIPFKMKEAREATSYQKDDDKHFFKTSASRVSGLIHMLNATEMT